MNFRKLLFWLHLTAGVIAGIVILIMSVTGVALMYQRQITAWADGIKVPAASAEETRLSVEALLEKVQQSNPATPTAVTISSVPGTAATFSFGREKTVYVNPYTGEILGEGSKRVRSFFQLMIEVHRWLRMDGDNRAIGKAITGASNLAFVFLVVTGLYLWWPRQLTARAFKSISVFDRSLSGKARNWNWHNVIGIWCAIPLFFIATTAVFFNYAWANNLLYRATGAEPPAPPKPAASAPARTEKPQPVTIADLNKSWAIAEKQMPGWRTVSLRWPATASAPLAFTIDAGNGARPDLRAQLTLNSKTGDIEKWEPYQSHITARKIRLWIRWVHTGEAGGFLGQTIAGVASAGGVFLVWTGIALALRRLRNRKTPVDTNPETVPSKSSANV